MCSVFYEADVKFGLDSSMIYSNEFVAVALALAYVDTHRI